MRRGFSHCTSAVIGTSASWRPTSVLPSSAANHMPLHIALCAAAHKVLAVPEAFGALHCSRRHLHSSARAHPQVLQQDAPYNDLVTIDWSEICAVRGQGDRFNIDVDRILVFDSPARLKVRNHVWRFVGDQVGIPLPRALRDKDEQKVVITGVGGNGKSHNVMLLVKELRDKGHVVVYIHDIECLLDDPWDVVLRELLFGVCRANVAAEVIDHAWTFIHTHCCTASSPNLGGPWLLGDVPLDMKVGAAGIDLDHLDRLIDTLRVLIRKHDKQKCRRIIFVGDQDNKLHRALEKVTNANVHVADQMIHQVKFDIKVLCASTNNEGWERRYWRNVIEQDIDEVSDSIAKQLFPNAAGDGGLVEEVTSTYSRYPLFWGLAEKAFLRKPYRARAELTKLCAAFFDEKCASAAAMVARLDPWEKDTFLCNLYHYGTTTGEEPTFFDRSLFQISNHQDISERCSLKLRRYSLKPICHAAVMCLWDAFPLHTIDLALFSQAFGYDVLFLHVLYARFRRYDKFNTLTPSNATNLDVASLAAAHTKAPRSLFAHVFAAPPRCPSYDAVVLRKTPRVLEVVFFQSALNATHSDSFRRFMEDKVGEGGTQLERSVDALRAFYPRFSGAVDVKFVWVLGGDSASVELEDWNNEPPTCEDADTREVRAKRPSRLIFFPEHSDTNQFCPVDGVLAALDRVLHKPAFAVVSGPTSVDVGACTRFRVAVGEYAVRVPFYEI
jgi:hypothetical protein